MFNSKGCRVPRSHPVSAGGTSGLTGVCIRQVRATTMEASFSSGTILSGVVSHGTCTALAVSSLQQVPDLSSLRVLRSRLLQGRAGAFSFIFN